MNGPIYEHVRVQGKPSHLYRLAGYRVDGRFHKATRPSGLKTLAQWRALETRPALRTAGIAEEHETMRWRCSMCLSYLKAELDATGQYLPCSVCGFSEERGPRHVPEDDKYPVTYAVAPPDTGARIVAYQAARAAGVPPPGPVSAPLIPLRVSAERITHAFAGNVLDRVVERQRALGQRPPDPYKALHVMDTKTPCSRCRKSPALCGCVPLPRDTLAECAKRAAIRTQQEQGAAMIAYPQLSRGTL